MLFFFFSPRKWQKRGEKQKLSFPEFEGGKKDALLSSSYANGRWLLLLERQLACLLVFLCFMPFLLAYVCVSAKNERQQQQFPRARRNVSSCLLFFQPYSVAFLRHFARMEMSIHLRWRTLLLFLSFFATVTGHWGTKNARTGKRERPSNFFLGTLC